jgi:hypothetical protein
MLEKKFRPTLEFSYIDLHTEDIIIVADHATDVLSASGLGTGVLLVLLGLA